MSNIEAAWIAGVVFTAILADLVLNGGHACFFLVLKLFDLIEYIKFWD